MVEEGSSSGPRSVSYDTEEEEEEEDLPAKTGVAATLSRNHQICASLAAAFSAVSAGSVVSWTAGAGGLLLENGVLPYTVTLFQVRLCTSLMPLGAAVGSLFSGTLAHMLGRKLTLQGMALPCITSWVILLFGRSVWWLYIGRFIGGVSIGIVYTTAMVYIVEVSRPSSRGFCCALVQIGFSFGLMYSYAMNVLTGRNFHHFTTACMILPFLAALLMHLVPESPQYLLQKHQYVRAVKNLQWLRGDEEDIEDEFEEIKEAVERRIVKIYKDKATRKAFIISSGLMALQQLSGINTVLMNLEDIVRKAGIHIQASFTALIIGVVLFFTACIAAGIVDRVGRKILLYISDGIMGVSMLLLLLSQILQLFSTAVALYWTSFCSLLVYVSAYNLGLGPLPWVLMAELTPQKIRSPVCGVVSAISWLTCTLVCVCYFVIPSIIANYALYTISCFLGLLFIRLAVFETAWYTLGEIQEILRN